MAGSRATLATFLFKNAQYSRKHWPCASAIDALLNAPHPTLGPIPNGSIAKPAVESCGDAFGTDAMPKQKTNSCSRSALLFHKPHAWDEMQVRSSRRRRRKEGADAYICVLLLSPHSQYFEVLFSSEIIPFARPLASTTRGARLCWLYLSSLLL
jgi:hypothetical protein